MPTAMSSPSPLRSRPRRCTAAAAGGLLWFSAVCLLAFGGPAITGWFDEFGVRLSQATLAVLRASRWLSGHAFATVAVLAAVVLVSLVVVAESRRFRASGPTFLLTGLGAWVALALTILLPAMSLSRTAIQ